MRINGNVLVDPVSERDRQDYHSIVELVRAQATANPKQLAVAHGEVRLTYSQLDAESNRMAHYLVLLGVRPEMVVGLLLDHSIQFIVAALAILKAGGAYLSLDSTHPPERLSSMLKNAGAIVVITAHQRPELDSGPWTTVALEDNGPALNRSPETDPGLRIAPNALAYLIYTSGSTGKPKGVEVTHNNLMNLVLWHQRVFEISPNDRAPFMASAAFDAAVWEIWPYLTAGASLHLLSDRSIYTVPQSLRSWFLKQRITIGFVPSPLAEQMLRLNWPRETPLRIMLTGADTLHEYPRPGLPFQLVNNYGPTECTVVATSGTVEPAGNSNHPPSIGRPIDEMQAYILNANLEPTSVGGTGEIYIGGAGVARGYRNDPELTAQKFIRNPFSTTPGDRLYRTGDFGYFLEDGRIMFSGRADNQVKIGARRVDTDEIVAVLDRHGAVQACAVVAREDVSGNKFLAAYVVPKPNSELTSTTLREFLRRLLPEYMVPKMFIQISELPLTSHGKVDRGALPIPTCENGLREEIFIPPQTEMETQLGTIIAALLGTSEVGVHDNFFMLGGNSFLGVQLIARLRETFGVEVPLRALFEVPTIAQLSAHIAQLRAHGIEADPQCAAD
jgi:amino acid adenylation domain-containing protein